MNFIMRSIFLLIALTSSIYASAQNPVEANRAINRASEWSLQSARQAKKIDSSKLVKKTIAQEIALAKALDVLIDMSGELIINTWNENKIKIETTVQFEDSNKLTDTQWFDKIGINMKLFGSTVRVKSRTNSGVFYASSAGATMYRAATPIYFTNAGFNMQTGPVTLYIPAESILEIESKNGRLKIRNNIKSLLLDNTDGEIEFANIEKLQIRSNRGSFSGGIVIEADVELSHVRFSLKQLNKGLITSNYSTIEIESLKDVKLSSSNDEIDIDNAITLYGIKNYGNLRINQLAGKLELQGINSDVKLRHISPSAQMVKIINRNADLRLSSNDLSNFSVDIKGSYNKVYSAFAENMTFDTLTTQEIESVRALTNTATSATHVGKITGDLSNEEKAVVNIIGTTFSQYAGGGKVVNNVPISVTGQAIGNKQNPYLKYSAKIGTGNSQLKYQIICTSCVIDFK
jgi:hypothetical protein